MKIALALENFSVHAGGAESYAVHLARRLIVEGWEVHLYGYSWDEDPPEAVFHRMPRPPDLLPAALKILHFALTHRKMIRDEAFDVILGFGNTLEMNVYQSHGGVHAYSSERKLDAVGSPVLRSLKALGMKLSPKHYARAWIESAPFRMSPRPVIVAIADMIRRDMADYYGISPDEARLVYNGIDAARFVNVPADAREAIRDRLGFRDETLYLFMAYDFRKKGVRYLIEAAAELRDIVGEGAFGVVVVGRSPSPSLRRLAHDLGLERIVVFPGPTREPEVFYSACDVFVLPTFYDACSLVVFEAMAAGLPAITTVHNGAAGIITSGTDGTVIRNPSNSTQIAEAMAPYLDDDHLRRASEAATATAARYTVEANHRRMLEIFAEAAGRGAPKTRTR